MICFHLKLDVVMQTRAKLICAYVGKHYAMCTSMNCFAFDLPKPLLHASIYSSLRFIECIGKML